MARVRGYSEDEVDIFVRDFTRVVQQSLNKACAVAAANLRPAQVLAAAGPTSHLGPEDVAVVTQAWQEEVDGVLTPYVAELYVGSATSVAVGMVDAFPDVDLPGVPLVADEFAQTYMSTVTNRLVNVGDEVWEDVRNELLDGVAQGQSIPQLAARVQAVAGFDPVRATRIARTEVHGAAEAGSVAQVRYVGYGADEATKEWVATHDLRTRMSHNLADGQQVTLGEKFVIGGHFLDFPGDPSGPADEIINCRCTTVFDLDGPPPARCGGALVAAPPPSATTCVVPLGPASIDHLSFSDRTYLFDGFMASQKISPAWGGAKIYKQLKLVRAQLEAIDPDFASTIDDRQFLAAVDSIYGKKGKKTFLEAFDEWSQTPNGKKAIGPSAPTPTHAKSPITVPSEPVIQPAVVTPQVEPPPLPAIAPKPAPGDLVYTGKTLGSHGAQVWENPTTGERWLFKAQDDFLTELDIALAKLQSKAGLTRPAIYKIKLNGENGSLQFMFESKPAFPGGSFDPLTLSAEDITVFQQEQIFDWLISNHDTHSGQWIRLADGRLYGVDKGQAYKFFGKDQLSWTYVPVTPLGQDKLTYTAIWKAFVSGKDIDLHDPTIGPLGEYMQRLMDIPDDTFRALIAPYVETAAKKFGFDSKILLDGAVKRKNQLKHDFEAFWAKALAEREKNIPKLPTPAPKPVTPTPSVSPAVTTGIGTSDLGDITQIPFNIKVNVDDAWFKLAGNKKVTPAWGGAKIYKLVQEVKKEFKSDGVDLTDLQILRILDQMQQTKKKKFETVVMEWLDTPASTQTWLKYGLLDDSLKKAPPKPTVTPVVSPTKLVLNEPTDAFDYGQTLTEFNLFDEIASKKKNTILAYAQEPETGDILRAVSDVTDGGDPLIVVERFVNGTWKHDEIFSTPHSLFDFYDFKADAHWYAVTPKASTTLKPTIIAGKMPGDVATGDELWESRFLWKEGDILAESVDVDSSGGVVQYRLVVGRGFITFERRPATKTTWDVEGKYFTSMKFPPEAFKSFEWKLTGDVLQDKHIPSKITGKNVGDVVAPSDIWHGSTGAQAGDVLAYAQTYQQDGGLLRLKFSDTGLLRIELREAGSTHWKFYKDVSAKAQFDYETKNVMWRAAKIDGGIPDEVLASTPGKGVGKTLTKMPGVYEGEPIGSSMIIEYADEFGEFEIIATGTHVLTGEEYRIYLVGFTYVRERKVGGSWKFDGIIHDLKNPVDISHPVDIKWTASSDVASPGSFGVAEAQKAVDAAVKAATPKKPPAKKVLPKKAPAEPPKKATLTGDETHIPGKSVGDSVSQDEVFAHWAEYEDGTIVAYTETTWGATRVVTVDGKLVLQQKTAAGAWKNDKIITHQWQLYGKWHASNEKLGKPQLNAAKKFVAKKTGVYNPPSSTSVPKSTVPKAPLQITPFDMRDVDITPWSDAEQDEMFLHFRGKSVYTSSSAEQVWSALQATKSYFQSKYGGKYTKLNEVELLRIIDRRSAFKSGVLDTHPFEAKIVQWLKTPQGKFHVSRRIDAPILARDVPSAPFDFEASTIPHDKQDYKIFSVGEAKKASDESHARYGAWTEQQKKALRSYTGGVYGSWNQAIRRGELGSYRASITAAQRGMRPSTRPMLLHRGTSFAELSDPSITSYETLLPYVGRTYTSRGFNSTSVGGTPGFGGQLIIEYECPVGTPMAWVEQISMHKSEREMLLPTHLVFKIISVKQKGGQTVMRVRPIGAAE